MLRRSLTVRARWGLMCAALVTASGAVVLALMLVMTDRLLHDAAPRALATQPPIAPGGPRPPSADIQRRNNQQRLDAGHDVTTDVIREVRLIGFITLGGLALVSVGVGWVVAGRMIRPLHRITAAAAMVSGARLGDRIDLDGPDDELKAMADTFDAMLDRLDVAFAAQRTFVADASHELRTPLAVMRTGVEVALDNPDADVEELRGVLQLNVAMLERTSDLVDRLLALSRAETLVNVVDHDLAESVRAAVSGGATASLHHPVELQLDEALVRGDPILLDRLATNLFDNASTHNVPDGRIWLTTLTSGDRATLIVENDGALVDAADVDRLFERFIRANPTAPGSGVGLAVVAGITRTHGGVITASARPQGGLRIEISLPSSGQRPSTEPVLHPDDLASRASPITSTSRAGEQQEATDHQRYGGDEEAEDVGTSPRQR